MRYDPGLTGPYRCPLLLAHALATQPQSQPKSVVGASTEMHAVPPLWSAPCRRPFLHSPSPNWRFCASGAAWTWSGDVRGIVVSGLPGTRPAFGHCQVGRYCAWYWHVTPALCTCAGLAVTGAQCRPPPDCGSGAPGLQVALPGVGGQKGDELTCSSFGHLRLHFKVGLVLPLILAFAEFDLAIAG